jgi:hypothetical protein
LAQIERRQARIRRIRARNFANTKIRPETLTNTANVHHHIGKSQDHWEHLGSFLQKHSGDPAIEVCTSNWLHPRCGSAYSDPQNFVPKLKQHLLPRIKSTLRETKTSDVHLSPAETPPASADLEENDDWRAVLLEHDRIYKHNIMRVNFTTYDVRRADDMIHPTTSHCNIMVLNPMSSSSEHPFWYARVLGIFHTNVIYTGTEMMDYCPRRLEFLWVRWYKKDNTPAGWDARRLDCVYFPPMSSEHAFGFIDPTDVLRSCHIIPAHARGKLRPDSVCISHCAQDGKDWHAYYINR